MVSKLTLLCSIYHMFLVPLYGVQTVIAVLHLPYVPRAPVWCPTCHCCAPSTICSLCPCMVPKLSLLCSIYHMFLVPLVWCPNCHSCAPSTICSLSPYSLGTIQGAQGTYGRWSTAMRVWAPYRGTRNIW